MVKDGKYRLKVEDVICEDAILKKDYSSIKCIPPYEGDNYVKSTMFSTIFVIFLHKNVLYINIMYYICITIQIQI